jgi:hypothetical protein
MPPPAPMMLVLSTLMGAAGPEKDGVSLVHPTPRELMREMSTDRPDATESPFTVDAGHVQIEVSFFDFSRDRADGETTRVFAAAPMLLKVGLLNDVDLQLGFDPFTRASGTGDDTEGFGDTTLRLKMNLWGNDGGPTAFALMPFVTFPTATEGLGADRVEGGLIAPLAVELPLGFSAGLMAEIDFVHDGEDYTTDFVHTATIARTLIGDLGAFVEYAGTLNLNGAADYRATFNTGATYGLTPNLQLDAGVRIGLTDAAEDVGFFAGFSWRR